MSDLVPPHGSGELKPLLAVENELERLKAKANGLLKVDMSTKEVSDVLMFAIGAYTPLDGFMSYDDWRSVCEHMQLKNGVFWPIPITLSCKQAKADQIIHGDEIALCDKDSGEIYAIMKVEEKYKIDRDLESQNVYGTTDIEHPGVQKIMNQGEVNLAGPVSVLSEGDYPEKYKGLYFTPAQTRNMFKKNGWTTIAAFQTRNPMHRSHEHLVKIAVEVCDGVFIHQVLGALKPGDIPAEVRVDAINTLVNHYFVEGTVITGGYPIEMRYAGPREALFHALLRQNFGCSHLIVGRDHAGVGDYYGPFDAQDIFDKIPNESLKTQPLKIEITFYCYKCDGMATAKTCPHSNDDRLNISGTKLRSLFSDGKKIPVEFSRPEVVEVLQKYYDNI